MDAHHVPIRDAAQRSGYSPEYIRQLIRRGLVKAELPHRRLYLVDMRSLEKYKAMQEEKAGGQKARTE